MIVAELFLLLEYFDECTIKVTVLLEYLNNVFSICGCILLHTHNSLIFNSIVSSSKGSFLYIVHFYSIFQLIFLRTFTETVDSLIRLNQSCTFYQGWVKLHISYSIDL